MTALIARRPFTYLGQSYRTDQQFDMEAIHAAILIRRQDVAFAPKDQPRQKRRYRRRDMTADA